MSAEHWLNLWVVAALLVVPPVTALLEGVHD
jgi:hypothetical protein